MIIFLYSAILTTGADKMAQIDPHGWTLTLISVLVVFTALVILFCVYSIFGKIGAGKLQKTDKPEKHSKTDSNQTDSDVDVAIATAVSLYLSESVHEEESGVITIVRRPSAWNSARAFRKLPK